MWYEVAAVAFLVVAVVGGGMLARRAFRVLATAVVLAGSIACDQPAPDSPAQEVASETAGVASAVPDSAPSSVPGPPASLTPHGPPSSRVDTTLFGSVRVILEDTTLTLSDGRTRTTTSLLDHINSSDDYRHTLLNAQRSGDGWIYLLIRTTGLSRPHTPNGYCGAGEETDLVWTAVDPALRVVKAQSALIASCLRTRDPLDDKIELAGEPWSITSYIPGDSLMTTSYDRRQPEHGLRMTTVPDTTRR
jgi:hypothetical protein